MTPNKTLHATSVAFSVEFGLFCLFILFPFVAGAHPVVRELGR